VRVPPALLGKRPALRDRADPRLAKSLDNFSGHLLQRDTRPDW